MGSASDTNFFAPLDWFRYENELTILQLVEADINGLHKVLAELTRFRPSLESEFELLGGELNALKKNHAEVR